MRDNPAPRRWLPLAAAAAAAVGTLTACSSSDSSDRPTPPPGLKPANAPSYDPARGARADAVARGCKQKDDGNWLFGGEVSNHSKDPRTYSIVVDFVTERGSTVVDTKVVKVPGVKPGESEKWTVAGATGRDKLRCVIRNVQH